MRSFTGLFRTFSLSGFLCALFCWSKPRAPVCRGFFCGLSCKGLFCALFRYIVFRAFFRRGIFHSLLCRIFIRALRGRGCFRALFCRAFAMRSFGLDFALFLFTGTFRCAPSWGGGGSDFLFSLADSTLVLSFARLFQCFSQRLLPGALCKGSYCALLRRAYFMRSSG